MVRTCDITGEHSRGRLNKAPFSPAEPRRARRAPSQARPRRVRAEAYPLGRTVRRIRSTKFVRAAELVRRPGHR
jgi:hypothetical protein